MLFQGSRLFLCLGFLRLASAQVASVTLSDAIYTAAQPTGWATIYTFKNIRFGAAPTGTARFQKPTAPAGTSLPSLAPSSYGSRCIAVTVSAQSTCPPTKPCPQPTPAPRPDEDCLFLDVYVPQSVFAKGSAANVPVVVWFFGGAYVLGSKDGLEPTSPFYTGRGLIHAAAHLPDPQDIIFVAGNYRLGAFGWLAGPSMESAAAPNAGLWDQRLVLQWVQDNIASFGGSKQNVSAWGESAGAGSILHHLLYDEGNTTPLFHTALLQSPAFQWQWDRSSNGTLETVFQNFATDASCSEKGASDVLECLSQASTADLIQANQALFDRSRKVGLFPVGPAIDNAWLSDIPSVALYEGKFWKGLKSILISHVFDESKLFIPCWVQDDADIAEFVDDFMPEASLDNIRHSITSKYTSKSYGGAEAAISALIRDSVFTCNTRFLFDAYSNLSAVYMMQYAYPIEAAALHASDLVPTFWYPGFDVMAFAEKVVCRSSGDAFVYGKAIKHLAPNFQKYLASFAAIGNPNAARTGLPQWSVAKSDVQLQLFQVMNVRPTLKWHPNFHANYTDPINTESTCNFWRNLSENITLAKLRQNEKEPFVVQNSPNEESNMEL